MSSDQPCPHPSLCTAASPHAREVGYKQPPSKQRSAATRPTDSQQHNPPSIPLDANIFPAPLVLPGDDLSLDPEYPLQSFQDWLDETDRNAVTPARRTIYIVAPPEIGDDASFMRGWTRPRASKAQRLQDQQQFQEPQAQDIVGYIAAFYHGISVKLLQVPDFRFVPWEDVDGDDVFKAKKPPRYIGLAVSDECTGIRTRTCPDKLFPRQLSLDDLLDVAISLLPKDAYALCLLVSHDLYESEDDTFVCGRAYGGSRVAVVSSARYCPSLDDLQSVERVHAWPASHCETYVRECISASGVRGHGTNAPNKRQKFTGKRPHPGTATATPSSPLAAAISAISRLPTIQTSPQPRLSSLWLSRMCRTASHEVGHCFGLDHCGYYACIMQGSASLTEDARQPPYLCPVDLAKLVHATNTTAREHYTALWEYGSRDMLRDSHFVAFAAWLTEALRLMPK